jgi:Fe-S-cluster containining protein
MQKTCCQRAEILVTDGDLARIARHTNQTDFWERRAPKDPEYLDDDADDPDWKRLTVHPDGTRRVLKRHPSGDCTFLGKAGCVLPEEVRPIVCRLYPWSYTHEGLQSEDADYCPIEKLDPAGKHGGSMLRILKMNPADAQRWHTMLYHELKTGQESP